MSKMEYCISITILLSVVLFAAESSADEAGYEYVDCSSQAAGILLTGCKRIAINSALTSVFVGDVFEDGIKRSEDREFLAIEGKLLPLAVPRVDYNNRDSWGRGTYRYVKIKKNYKLFPQNELGDVVAIVSDVDKMDPSDSVNNVNDYFLLKNTKITFLYSEDRGVLAIGIEDRGDSGSVYWCASKRCLFGAADKRGRP